MDENEPSSSTGLVIGMIVGGVLVVVLLLAMVLGVGFFFVAHDVGGPVAAPAPVVVAMDADVVPEVKPIPPALAVPSEQLIGAWEAVLKDGSVARWEFRGNGEFTLKQEHLDKPAIDNQGKWELRLAKGGPEMTLIRVDKGNMLSHDIRFLDNDRFVLDGVQYERRKIK